jgi:hypothetical protein
MAKTIEDKQQLIKTVVISGVYGFVALPPYQAEWLRLRAAPLSNKWWGELRGS